MHADLGITSTSALDASSLSAFGRRVVAEPGRTSAFDPRTMRDAPPEEEWIARARAGDRGAFDELVRLHYRAVNAFTACLTANRQDAEDLAQEAFVRAHSNLPEFRGESHFGAWLRAIAFRLAQDERRRVTRRGRSLPIESAAATPARAADPLDASAQAELAAHVRNALAELPLRLRAVIVLRAVEGRDYDEIASILGLRPATVRTQVVEARRELSRLLAPRLREERP